MDSQTTTISVLLEGDHFLDTFCDFVQALAFFDGQDRRGVLLFFIFGAIDDKIAFVFLQQKFSIV